MNEIKPIETSYQGCRFRSRLEARWAVFFDAMGIAWQYEPQGYVVNGIPYLPDFLLDCGSWVEVRGDPARVDSARFAAIARGLPRIAVVGPKMELGPRLLVVGAIPPPRADPGDWGWVGVDQIYPGGPADALEDFPDGVVLGRYGFGIYSKNRRPWWLDWCEEITNEPIWDGSEDGYAAMAAYEAARSARF
jgi:hypothetical protein